MAMDINDEARAELLSEVAGLSDEDINKKPAEGVWSIRQVLEHLYLMEGAVTKTINYQLASGKTESVTNKPIELSTNRDIKVDAPDFAIPGEEFLTLDHLKERLAETHEGLRKVAVEADEEQLASIAYPHPAFGKLSLKQYIPFVGYHELRHVEQIKEVKTKLHL